MHSHWIEAAHQLSRQGEAYVIATLIGVAGSTPRNSGSKMVITSECSYDSIGGGHMEHQVIQKANQLLAQLSQSAYSPQSPQSPQPSHSSQPSANNSASAVGQNQQENIQCLEHFQLGAKLGQCCGGTATVLFECFAASQVNIMVFGAGHVGQALISILAGLPCKVRWVDSRESQFPAPVFMQSIHNVTTVVSDHPADEISAMPNNSYYVVMTHNHQLDFEICQKILQQQRFAYLGLIASQTKWRRFRQRFSHRNIDPQLVDQMSCPIGLAEVPGKKPMEIAVSIAAELIGLYQPEQPKKTQVQPLADISHRPTGSVKRPIESKPRQGQGQGVSYAQVKPLIAELLGQALDPNKSDSDAISNSNKVKKVIL